MQSTSFYYYFLLAWSVIALSIFVVLMFIRAPYGRYSRKGFGPMVGRRLGWILMETPAALGMVLFFFLGNRLDNLVALVFLGMWLVHYIYRTYIFPFRMRGSKKSMTLTPVVLAVFFNFANTYINGHYLFTLGPIQGIDWLTTPHFIVGALVFLVGLSINVRSDNILRALRKKDESNYGIPTGGMFKYVSAANYFGELVEWVGFAIATMSPGALVFFIWTFANLVPRGISHHKWYQKTFPDYPAGRKAVIPFIL